MPIIPFLRGQAFDPEAVSAMSAVFDRACNELGLLNRADQITTLLAQHIIECAERGVRTRTALYLNVMQEFRANPQ